MRGWRPRAATRIGRTSGDSGPDRAFSGNSRLSARANGLGRCWVGPAVASAARPRSVRWPFPAPESPAISSPSLVCLVASKESGIGPPSQLYAVARRLLQKARCTSGGACGLPLLHGGRQQLSSEGVGLEVSVHVGWRSPLPRGQAVHRAVRADGGARRGDREAAPHHLRREAADPAARAGREAGVALGHDRRALRLRRRSLAVVRGLHRHRHRVEQSRRVHGRDDRDHPGHHQRRVLLLPGQARSDSEPADLPGAE